MNSRDAGCLGLAAALVLGAAAGAARADEPREPALQRSARPAGTALARSAEKKACITRATPATGAISSKGLRSPAAVAPPQCRARRAATAPLAPAVPGALDPLGAHAAPAGATFSLPSGQPGAKGEAASPAVEAASEPKTLVLSEELFAERSPMELFNSVIVPAARGVTIAQIETEGFSPVTLAVRPTKITRGGGLVAVGQF